MKHSYRASTSNEPFITRTYTPEYNILYQVTTIVPGTSELSEERYKERDQC